MNLRKVSEYRLPVEGGYRVKMNGAKKKFPLIAYALLAIVLAGGVIAGAASNELQVVEHEELGAHLADGEGMSLYVFLPDEAGPSTCNEQCADAWPPLVVADPEILPRAAEGVDEDLIGVAERDDGTFQVSYNGWPLYYFAKDEEAGDTRGQGAGEKWYLASPEGTPLGAPEEREAAEEAAGDDDAALATLMDEGGRVFRNRCAQCHGEQGDQALSTHVEELAGNARAVRVESRVIRQVVFGGSYMPSFGDVLSDREVAAVVSYVRNSWGHEHGATTEEEVHEVREQFE